MKVLFLENRQQTAFWEAIASRLVADGHEVSWIVQNPVFEPAIGTAHRVRFPRHDERSDARLLPPDLARIVAGDRNVNYFGGSSTHYAYYARALERILDDVAPAVVFGEPTLFHERLCIALCRRRGIPYYYPGSCRYPPGRFAFFEYDSLKMVAGSGELLGDEAARDLLGRIRARDAVPDYMRAPARPNALGRISSTLRNDVRIAAGWLRGERFNTPSPVRKLGLQRTLAERRRAWTTIASPPEAIRERFRILFPLQMQPEANLDVWGGEWRDQETVLRRIAAVTDAETAVVVKANPKSKYELTPSLIDFIASHPRVHAMPLDAPMKPLFDDAQLVVTVTGTVAMECVFHRKPIAVLSRQMHEFVPSARYLPDPAAIGALVETIRAGGFEGPGEDGALDFLRSVVRQSHPGWISNPYSAPTCLGDGNVSRVHAAFVQLLGELRARRAQVAP